MWRILNKIFGWHYVWIKDCGDSHIRRVIKLPDGSLMGTIVTRKFIIEPDGNIRGAYYIEDWKPLTWEKK